MLKHIFTNLYYLHFCQAGPLTALNNIDPALKKGRLTWGVHAFRVLWYECCFINRFLYVRLIQLFRILIKANNSKFTRSWKSFIWFNWSFDDVSEHFILAKYVFVISSINYKPVTSTFILMQRSNAAGISWSEGKQKKINVQSGLLDKSPNGQKSDGHEDVHRRGKARAGRVRDGVENLIVHLYLFLVLSQRLSEEREIHPRPLPNVSLPGRREAVACVNWREKNCGQKRMKLLLGFFFSWPHPLLSSSTTWWFSHFLKASAAPKSKERDCLFFSSPYSKKYKK